MEERVKGTLMIEHMIKEVEEGASHLEFSREHILAHPDGYWYMNVLYTQLVSYSLFSSLEA